jgi:hypothetical protein
MTKNLDTADRIAKLALAGTTLILYFSRLIQGPFAGALLILSVTVIFIYLIKVTLLRD